MNETQRLRLRRSAPTFVILGLSLALMVLALQVYFTQKETHRANRDRDNAIACQAIYASEIELWVNGTSTRDGLLAALQASREATTQVRKRDQHWHKRVDGVFQLIILSRTNPNIPDSVIDPVLSGYSKSSKKLFAAYLHAQSVQTANPFPKLDLNCSGSTR
jgi:hypothetical protein